MDKETLPSPPVQSHLRTWFGLTIRLLWYLFLIGLIAVLFQGPEKGFRYLGL